MPSRVTMKVIREAYYEQAEKRVYQSYHHHDYREALGFVLALLTRVSVETRALSNLRARGEKVPSPDCSFFWTASKTNSRCCSNIESGSGKLELLFASKFWMAAPGNGGKKKSIWSEVFIVRGGSGRGNLKIFDSKCKKLLSKKKFGPKITHLASSDYDAGSSWRHHHNSPASVK